MDNKNNITILIVVQNEIEELKVCIRAIRTFVDMENIEVIVIDNASVDGTSDWLAVQEDISYATTEASEDGYGKIINTAMELFHIEGNLLLMRPHYVITLEFISRMQSGLYFSENIGAVEPITDKNDYLINRSMDNYEVAATYAGESTQMEMKRVTLLHEDILFIKKEAIKSVGKFDEQFRFDRRAIMDYQLRIIQEGFCLKCVTNAVAFDMHQQGRTLSERAIQIAEEDKLRLKDKWGMNYFTRRPSFTMIDLINDDTEKTITVLEVGCDCGATLAEIKNCYPRALVYGYEMNPTSARIASSVSQVKIGNLEDKMLPYDEDMFDYIIFGDVLEHLRDPEGIIQYCKKYLKPNGCILASIPNLMFISVIKNLLEGNFTYQDTGLLDRTHIHMFTYNEIMRMFNNCDFDIEETGMTTNKINDAEEEYIRCLRTIAPETPDFMFRAY